LTYILWRIIWHPADEGDLAPLALTTIRIILDVEDCVSSTHALLTALVLAFGVEQLLPELAVVWVGRGLLHDNLLPVVGDLEDDPFGGFAELELVEGLDALGSDGDSANISVSTGSRCVCVCGR
jgi:hypothetical protein